MSYNISLLSEKERIKIELSRVASLEIRNLKIGRITRSQINKKIESYSGWEREYFRELLNFYNK